MLTILLNLVGIPLASHLGIISNQCLRVDSDPLH